MGLPTNKDNQSGCDNISSNCVIWQGPDIPCIKLCKGDTISDVTAKLAQQLCDMLDQLEISTLDLSCFNLVCPAPSDMQGFMQLLIDRICALESCCEQGGGTPSVSSVGNCPDCIVNVAACFQVTNGIGDVVSTMQLSDYVNLIGRRVCALVNQISTMDSTLRDHEQRITTIEQTCCNEQQDPEILIPSSCLQTGPPPTGGWPIEVILQTLETAFCELRSATGVPASVYQAIARQCAALDLSPSMAFPSSNMASLPGWVTQANYTSLSDSVSNMWLTICDLRAAVLTIQNTCCNVGCNDVTVILTANLNEGATQLNICLSGSALPGFQDCSPGGNLLTIQDALGNSYSTYIPVISNLNQPCVAISLAATPLNPAANFTITLNGCWNDIANGVSCGNVITYILENTVNCPSVIYTPSYTQVGYSFNNVTVTPIIYTIELWNGAGTSMISSQVVSNPAVGTVSGTFSTGITPSSTYKLRVKVTINDADTFCPFTSVTTLALACAAATDVEADGEL